MTKNLKYVIVDIPPAINVSFNELKNRYPNKKFLMGIDIQDNITMKKEIDKNDVIFIFPHQMKFLEKKYFDISIMIGVTLEMEPKDVKKYMHYVNILSKTLYMKVFKYSGLPFSFYKVYKYNNKKDYFINEKWKEIFCDLGVETDEIAHLGYNID